jgi:glycosyltransferase involved in cell wall biosynthesis
VAAAIWTARFRPNWIYASDPLSCPIALVLRLLGWRVIYHEHDSPSSWVGAGESRFSRFVRRARGALARRADLCVLPNGDRAEVFRETIGRAATTTVWNTPLIEETEADATVAAPAASDPARLRVLYHGSIVPSRLPMTVIDAIARLPEGISLSIAGYETAGHRGYVQALIDRAAELGIRDRIHIAGVLARQDWLERIHAAADDPEYLANMVFDRLVYGFHPYGKPQTGTPGTIAAIRREDLLAFPVPGTWSIQQIVIHLMEGQTVTWIARPRE